MLPFDNKSELQLVIDMPEGTTLEETARVTKALTQHVRTIPEDRNYQAYVGTASPFNFNGIGTTLLYPRGEPSSRYSGQPGGEGQPSAQSHEIAN